MSKSLLDRRAYDHPEHFDDDIREYRTSKRYIPTPLENSLFDLAGHRCTICHAPWLEIHHITELAEGGSTEYDNLIVLCPNCHTRVHTEGVPSKDELRHYKLKQEIAYELPILSRLSAAEKIFLSELSTMDDRKRLTFSKRMHDKIEAENQDSAIALYRESIGYSYLQEAGIVSIDLEHVLTLAEGKKVAVAMRMRLTSKGLKWIRYLIESGRVPEL